MDRSIYIAVSGGVAQERRLEILANNLANAATTGFKKDRPAFRMVPAGIPVAGPSGVRAMVEVRGTVTDFSPGPLAATGNPLDLALEGQGFFEVQTSQGMRYTRQGGFQLDPQRQMVTREGHAVLGEGGPITLPEAGAIRVDAQGNVYAGDDQVGTLKVVDFPPDRLRKEGALLFAAEGTGSKPERTEVRQGMIERANVEVVGEMVALIETLRAYESYQKIIQAFDDLAAKSNEMGRV